MKIGAKILTGFLALVFLMAVSGGISIYLMKEIRHTSDEIQDVTLPLMLKTNYAATNGGRMVAAMRGFVITGDDKFLNEFNALNKETDDLTEELLTKSITPAGKQFAQDVKKLSDAYEKIALEKVVPLKRAGKESEAVLVMSTELAPTAKATSDKLQEYIQFREKQINDTLDNSQDKMDRAQWIIIVFLFIAFFSAGAIAFIIIRGITRPLKAASQHLETIATGDYSVQISAGFLANKDETGDMARAMDKMIGTMRGLLRNLSSSADHLAASSEELTASADQSSQAANQVAGSMVDVANGATEQMRAVQETSQIIDQLSAGIQHVAANINLVADQSSQSADKAQAGGKAVDKAVSQMVQIEATVNTSAKVVAKLGERSQEIGQIVDAISGIAGQTNLLALNAAIEAARAGEQGRGFAVVAEEVRKLAEQSQEAAKKIADLINEIQGDTDKAVVAMNEGTREVKTGAEVVNAAGNAFGEITELVTQVSSQVREISAAVQQMAAGSQQIVDSVNKIDQFSKNTAGESQSVSAATEEQLASMEEIASASRALATLAQGLQLSVSKFRI